MLGFRQNEINTAFEPVSAGLSITATGHVKEQYIIRCPRICSISGKHIVLSLTRSLALCDIQKDSDWRCS
ncbi:MAG: hypothetical protein PHQ75_07570 [Thermoguttaceae bacterium]|nr:hypothetical protein [Thermoguttaceae bacterium]